MLTIRIKGKRYKFKPRFFIILLALVLIVVLCIAGIHHALLSAGGDNASDKKTTKKLAGKEDVVELNITCAGDIFVHQAVIDASATKDGYSFSAPFKYIKKYVKDADASIFTFEGTLSDEPYTGFPKFRTPKSLAKSMKKVGFKAVDLASNHAMDNGDEGFDTTIRACIDAGLNIGGVQENAEDPDHMIIESQDVKIAFLDYTYNDGSEQNPTLNGLPLSESVNARCNNVVVGETDSSANKIAEDCKKAREEGADVVILGMHWGDEYQPANAAQEALAHAIVDTADVDIIVGSHPHVVQKYEMLTSSDGKKKVPCYYAIGNLLSNQRRETMEGRTDVEEGVLARFTIDYDRKAGKIKEIKEKPMPYWIDKYVEGGKTKYAVVPLDKDLDSNEALATSGHLEMAKEARKNIYATLGIDQD